MLQIVAWSGMMVSFARTDGVAEAARKTFDGEHKCRMCHAIDATREAEQKQNGGSQAPVPDWSKFGKELALTTHVQAPKRLDEAAHVLSSPDPGWLWPVEAPNPPLPPPRAA